MDVIKVFYQVFLPYGPNRPLEHVYLCSGIGRFKGQIISKANYLDLNSSKKQTKNLYLVARARAKFCLFFDRFLEELKP